MSRANMEDNKFLGAHFKDALKGDVLFIAISAGFTIPPKPPFIVNIDPTGAQNITCPTKGSKFIFIIQHGSTNNADLTIKDSAAATIGTLSQNEMGWVVDNGVTTRFITGLTT